MQPPQRLERLAPGRQDLLQWQTILALQHLLQCFAPMPVVQQIEGRALAAISTTIVNIHQIVRRA